MTSADVGGPVLLVVAGGAVSHAAIARTAELAAGAPVTVVGVGTAESSRTSAVSAPSRPQSHNAGPDGQRVPSPRPAQGAGPLPSPWAGFAGRTGKPSPQGGSPGGSGGSSPHGDIAAGSEPEQVRRTVALAMSVLEATGVMATGHVAVTGAPARAVARVARACGARVVILDQTGPGSGTPPARAGARPSRAGTGTGGLMAELRRRMYGSGVVVLAETNRRGGWVSQ